MRHNSPIALLCARLHAYRMPRKLVALECGDLTASDAAALERHIAGCARCREQAARAAAAGRALSAGRPEPPELAAGRAREIFARARQGAMQTNRARRAGMTLVYAGASAAVAATCVLSLRRDAVAWQPARPVMTAQSGPAGHGHGLNLPLPAPARTVASTTPVRHRATLAHPAVFAATRIATSEHRPDYPIRLASLVGYRTHAPRYSAAGLRQHLRMPHAVRNAAVREPSAITTLAAAEHEPTVTVAVELPSHPHRSAPAPFGESARYAWAACARPDADGHLLVHAFSASDSVSSASVTVPQTTDRASVASASVYVALGKQ